jgi:hypothetical protein
VKDIGIAALGQIFVMGVVPNDFPVGQAVLNRDFAQPLALLHLMPGFRHVLLAPLLRQSEDGPNYARAQGENGVTPRALAAHDFYFYDDNHAVSG